MHCLASLHIFPPNKWNPIEIKNYNLNQILKKLMSIALELHYFIYLLSFVAKIYYTLYFVEPATCYNFSTGQINEE